MAVITKIGGVATSGTSGVNNIFGSGGGGGGITAPALGTTTGIQIFGTATGGLNPDIDATFNRTEVGLTQYSGTDFVAIAIKSGYASAFAVTSDGKMHYNTGTNTWMSSQSYTADSLWHEDTFSPTGTSGNWTWVSCDDNSAMAIRGGDVCFMGYGNYRQRGDGSTSSVTRWEKTFDGSSDPAVRCFLNYRSAYVLTQSGKVYATGYRYEYQTGEGTSSGQQTTFTDITPSGVTATQIALGYRSGKFLDSAGDIWSWGDNNNQHAGPLRTGTSDIGTPTQSTNNQQFAGGTLLGGFDGDMYMVVDSSGELWVQGEGGTRMSPESGNTDRKNAWHRASTIPSGTFSTSNMMMSGISTTVNMSCLVRNDGTMTMTGSKSVDLTGSISPTGTQASGNPPHQVFTHAGCNVHQAIGNLNRMIVTFRS